MDGLPFYPSLRRLPQRLPIFGYLPYKNLLANALSSYWRRLPWNKVFCLWWGILSLHTCLPMSSQSFEKASDRVERVHRAVAHISKFCYGFWWRPYTLGPMWVASEMPTESQIRLPRKMSNGGPRWRRTSTLWEKASCFTCLRLSETEYMLDQCTWNACGVSRTKIFGWNSRRNL